MNTSWSGRYRSFDGALKKRVLARANHTCEIRLDGCAGRATIVDHKVPQARGGSHTEDNAQAACARCHDAKTKHEQKAGRARQPKRQRPPERHPGLLW